MKSLIKTLQEEASDAFEEEFPRFKGVGARHPIFEETPVYTHVKQFIKRRIASTATTLINTAVERMEKAKKYDSHGREPINGVWEGYYNQAIFDAQNIIKGLGEEK